MFCKNCGNKLHNDAKFCVKCGEKVIPITKDSTEPIKNETPIEKAESTNDKTTSGSVETASAVDVGFTEAANQTSGVVDAGPTQATSQTSGVVDAGPAQAASQTSGVIDPGPTQTTKASGVINATVIPPTNQSPNFNSNTINGQTTYTGGGNQPPSAKGPSNKTLKIIALLLIAVIIAGGAYIFFAPKQNSGTSSSSLSTEKKADKDKKDLADKKIDKDKKDLADKKNSKDKKSLADKKNDKDKKDLADKKNGKDKKGLADKKNGKDKKGLADKKNGKDKENLPNEKDNTILDSSFAGVWSLEGYKENPYDNYSLDGIDDTAYYLVIEENNTVYDIQIDNYNTVYKKSFSFEKVGNTLYYEDNDPPTDSSKLSITREDEDTIILKIEDSDGETLWLILSYTGENVDDFLYSIDNLEVNYPEDPDTNNADANEYEITVDDFNGVWLFEGYKEDLSSNDYDLIADQSLFKGYVYIVPIENTIYYVKIDTATGELLERTSAEFDFVDDYIIFSMDPSAGPDDYLEASLYDGNLVLTSVENAEKSGVWEVYSYSYDYIEDYIY